MADIIQFRRNTTAGWLSANPVLLAGMPGFESDTYKLKVGDGTTAWDVLPYASGSSTGGGSAWLSGSGVPDNADGVEGDYYLNTLNGDIYTKGPSTWGSVLMTINGEDGADGTDGLNWYFLNSDPVAQGIDGEMALNSTTWDVFKKISGTWSLIGNIEGGEGDPGNNGVGISSITKTSGNGAAGTTDAYTITYSDASTSVFYVYNGDDGTNGTNGTNGATWSTGAGVPNNANGSDGDLYLNTTNQDVYKKISGSWGSAICNIKGVQGVSGNIDRYSAALAADVQLPASGTWYNGPLISLPAGVWLINAQVTLFRNATTAANYFARITNGTNHHASSQMYHASVSGISVNIALTCIITLTGTTDIKIQATTSAGATTELMKAATTAYGSGNNATQINAIRLNS